MLPTNTSVQKSEEVDLDSRCASFFQLWESNSGADGFFYFTASNSTRKKIVIETKSSKSVAGKRTPYRTLSIFKSAVDQRPCIENTAKPESKPVQGLDKSAATEESNVKQKHPALPSRQSKAMVFISSPKADTPTPEPIKLIASVNPNYPSPYTEEYAKCPCAIGSRPPCQRCQLMCLSDRYLCFFFDMLR
jgi:hypothetical protein